MWGDIINLYILKITIGRYTNHMLRLDTKAWAQDNNSWARNTMWWARDAYLWARNTKLCPQYIYVEALIYS